LDEATGDGPYTTSAWLTGFASGGSVCGRPADVLVAPDGSVLISDELSGVVLRATRAI
jgi:glucose/arabinose dehydrogenase